MLDRNAGPTQVYSFLVTVEIEDAILSPEKVAARLADGISFLEGCGIVDVENFGTLLENEDEDE